MYIYICIRIYAHSDILSDILSGIYFDILSGIYSDILSGTYADILSDILSGFFLAFYLASILTFNSAMLSDIIF